MISLRRLAVALLTMGTAGAAQAQAVRGTVRDSASRQPIASAIVLLLDSADAPLARGISNERGEYRLERVGAARRLRALRIGFRPRDYPLAEVRQGVLDVTMTSLPTLLTAVRVEDAPNCPRRPDRAAAFALWEQARTGLLASVVASEVMPADRKLLEYERTFDGTSEVIVRQRVTIDSGRSHGSFRAEKTASGFVERGFMQEDGETATFYGPDADVLLHPDFARGYCFQLRADGARPREIGLGFVPVSRRTGRVDIDGTLWVDTAARTVREITYRYLGVDPRMEREIHPGGTVSFLTMPNGVVMVDRWSMRLPGYEDDSPVAARGRLRPTVRLFAREAGGEVARAVWSDGQAWVGRLGTLRATVVDARGRPVTGAVVRLRDTDYLASPDPRGEVELPDLLPGRYLVTVIDSAMARLGMAVGTPTRIVVDRDSVVTQRLVARTIQDYVGPACLGSHERGAVEGRVVTPAGAPALDARWELGEDMGTSYESIVVTGRVHDDGRFALCPTLPAERARVLQLRVWRESAPNRTEVYSLLGRRANLKITLPP